MSALKCWKGKELIYRGLWVLVGITANAEPSERDIWKGHPVCVRARLQFLALKSTSVTVQRSHQHGALSSLKMTLDHIKGRLRAQQPSRYHHKLSAWACSKLRGELQEAQMDTA